MTTLADQTISALRINRDDLAGRVREFTPADLDRTSGSVEWDVAQVLSHLGSGAEIGLDALQRALTSADPAPADFNQRVWDRWNALSQQDKANEFLASSESLLAAYEGLDEPTRLSLRIPMGFLPKSIDLTVLTGMRLNEALLHAWDVRVAFDPDATIPGPLAEILLEQLSGPLGFFLGFFGKPGALEGRVLALRVETIDPTWTIGLQLGESIALTGAPDQPDGELTIPTEALVRLFSGRLTAEHTPESVLLECDSLSLDDLRAVFPGF